MSEIAASCKSVLFYFSRFLWYSKRSEALAMHESTPSNARHALGDVDVSEIITRIESSPPDAR